LGKVQHLDYRVKQIWFDDPAYQYDFAAERFPGTYEREKSGENKVHKAIMNNTSPGFELVTFDGKKVSTETMKGKVVLLDFWEVWCGPCVASMPKVQMLYDKYKSKGLQVYGITNETDQLESARLLVQKKKIRFPMLTGNKQIEKEFGVVAIPLYILINKEGKISFISEGFSDKMEAEILKQL
jgi:thiol-disulfide isomerase/thioredoxin